MCLRMLRFKIVVKHISQGWHIKLILKYKMILSCKKILWGKASLYTKGNGYYPKVNSSAKIGIVVAFDGYYLYEWQWANLNSKLTLNPH